MGSDDRRVMLWRVRTGQRICTLFFAEPVETVVFFDDGGSLIL